ncbi:MAG: pirin family protein [Bacteroidota bacterium]
MSVLKKINGVVSSKPINLGGIEMKQPLPIERVNQIDPFLLIQHGVGEIEPGSDHRKLGVGPHPHRGFSPVTFIFKGSIHHRDSLEHSDVVEEGGTQWMHAGKGITHSERPGEKLALQGGESEIVQFWVNSPPLNKMDIPYYQPISKEETPIIHKNNSKIAIVAGQFEGISGPAKTLTPQILLRLTNKEGDHYSIKIPEDYNCLIYLLDGQLEVNGQDVNAEQMIWFKREGKIIDIKTKKDTRALLLSGEPIDEPVVSYGPFVMNTQTEIMEAIRDSQTGKMGILIENF